jgi:hypothetical protein
MSGGIAEQSTEDKSLRDDAQTQATDFATGASLSLTEQGGRPGGGAVEVRVTGA